MQKAADVADKSVLFFSAGANFWESYTYNSVEFCRDRRFRTFLKVGQKKLQHTCSKRGGVKGRLNNVKKNCTIGF